MTARDGLTLAIVLLGVIQLWRERTWIQGIGYLALILAALVFHHGFITITRTSVSLSFLLIALWTRRGRRSRAHLLAEIAADPELQNRLTELRRDNPRADRFLRSIGVKDQYDSTQA